MKIDLASAITEVTVYPQGGQVTRQGTATVDAAGEHALSFVGLPSAIGYRLVPRDWQWACGHTHSKR